MKADEILAKAAQTYRERNLIYGENFRTVGKVMDALFPDGVKLNSVEDHMRFHIFTWIIGKVTRYAAQWKEGGHRDSVHDTIVYAAILEMIDGELE